MFKNLFSNPFSNLLTLSKRVLKIFVYVVSFVGVKENNTIYNNTYDVNRQYFIIRENFYEMYSCNSSIFFLKKEWPLFFNKELPFYNFWLVLNNQKNYYAKQLFNLQQSNMYNKLGLIKNKKTDKKYKLTINQFNIYWGFLSVWNALKIWVFSLTFFFMSFYVLLVKRAGVLPQTLFFWIGVSMLLYWVLSGFVFFVKKYQYSRYTSVIQRFWRRTYILFWGIESCLLLVFFYLTFNSSQESFFMFDQSYFFKTHLFSWKIFLFKCTIIVSLITYSYLLLLNLKWSTFNKNIFNLVVITILLIYLVWTEFYQIYWVSNFYANFTWLYDLDESIWSLEWDARRTRILNHYIMILFFLKFWHIVFIFGCWIFFLLRSNELETITYPLYSFNFQNFIILFIMMWLFMYPWFKYTFHWLSELPYFWFYVDIHTSFFKILVNDCVLFYSNMFSYVLYNTNLQFFKITDFINWISLDLYTDTNVFIKSTIKNVVLKNLIQ